LAGPCPMAHVALQGQGPRRALLPAQCL
jgi:hypothetical protein